MPVLECLLSGLSHCLRVGEVHGVGLRQVARSGLHAAVHDERTCGVVVRLVVGERLRVPHLPCSLHGGLSGFRTHARQPRADGLHPAHVGAHRAVGVELRLPLGVLIGHRRVHPTSGVCAVRPEGNAHHGLISRCACRRAVSPPPLRERVLNVCVKDRVDALVVLRGRLARDVLTVTLQDGAGIIGRTRVALRGCQCTFHGVGEVGRAGFKPLLLSELRRPTIEPCLSIHQVVDMVDAFLHRIGLGEVPERGGLRLRDATRERFLLVVLRFLESVGRHVVVEPATDGRHLLSCKRHLTSRQPHIFGQLLELVIEPVQPALCKAVTMLVGRRGRTAFEVGVAVVAIRLIHDVLTHLRLHVQHAGFVEPVRDLRHGLVERAQPLVDRRRGFEHVAPCVVVVECGRADRAQHFLLAAVTGHLCHCQSP